MKPSKAVIDEINRTLQTFREQGLEQPPYVCISKFPFDGILRTEYGSVRFVFEPNAEDAQLYVISRRDYRLLQRRKARVKASKM